MPSIPPDAHPLSAPHRLHALDAARALALLLGIVLHATMSFFLGMPARDGSPSVALAVAFYVIHTFRMSLFFLLAGLLAHGAFHRRGWRSFVADRAKRILVPLVAGWVILAPLTIAAVTWGLERTYPEGLPAGANAATAGPQGFPLLHLWFLYYLCMLYVVVLGLRAGVVALDRDGVLRERIDALVAQGLASRLAPLALAAPTCAVLCLDPAWPVWFGIPTPDRGLAPTLPAVVAFGTALALGWLLARRRDLLDVLARQWASNLAVAVALTAACLAVVGPMPDLTAPTALAGGAGVRLGYAAGYAVAIWCWTLGLLGAAVRFCSHAGTLRRYLADAAYWLYLTHLPLVFALQVLAMDLPLHWAVKFPAIIAVTLAVLLPSYHYLVRPTYLGELLSGRRYPRRAANEPAAPALRVTLPIPPALGFDTQVAELVAVSKRYGQNVALDGLSLAVRPGELLAVLGPNGAGKSTAIGLWLGTLEPDAGVVRVLGGLPFDATNRLGVGVMMQEVALAPMLTAREHLTLTASYYRDPLTIAETLALTSTAPLAERRYGTLSAGQKRQVQFALAVCGRPRLLFLDEPTVGLDVAAREAMWRAIRELRATGCSIVLTTHYLEEAEALADRAVVLAKGRSIAEGSVDELRALVSRRRIRCASRLEVDAIRRWPGVVDAMREGNVVQVTASDAERVVRQLLAADGSLSQLEVQPASLAEAFTTLTQATLTKEAA